MDPHVYSSKIPFGDMSLGCLNLQMISFLSDSVGFDAKSQELICIRAAAAAAARPEFVNCNYSQIL